MVSKPLPIFFFQDGNFLICNHILFSATFVKAWIIMKQANRNPLSFMLEYLNVIRYYL